MYDDTRSLAERQDDLPQPQLEADAATKERLRQSMQPKRSSSAVTFVSALFLMLVIGAGGIAYFWFEAKQEVLSVRQDLATSEDTVTQLRKQVSDLKSVAVVNDDLSDLSGKTQQGRAVRMADEQLCNQASAKCAFVNPTVIKFRLAEPKVSPKVPGFANISVAEVDARGNVLRQGRYLLKSIDGIKWVVVYEGVTVPPDATIKLYGIPADFAK